MNTESLHKIFLESDGISTDTRKIKSNTIYFALKGDNFDGNSFAVEAIQKGASYAVVDNITEKNDRLILVEDVLGTLQQLANFHRNYLNIPILAITGSNGKTTTKKLCYEVLQKKWNCKATEGNLNNHIGVPLTLLSFDKKTEFGIVEMGANHQGEIAQLCKIAAPNYGIITNFGKAHLEGFGGFEGVIKGKSELYNYLKTHQGMLFVNADDTLMMKKTSDIKRYLVSEKNKESNLILNLLQANPFVKIKFNEHSIQSQLIGDYNFKNIAIAIAVGQYFEIPSLKIASAITDFSPEGNRSEIIKKNSNTILLDAYNANPTSMIAALESFDNWTKSKKIAILGDMFEVGENSIEEHQKITKIALSKNIDQVFLCGKLFHKSVTTQYKKLEVFESFDELKSFLIQSKFNDKHILIKGSRGMALERCLEFL
ncbi:MAG: UDP-N-acetylmuramoyl-tripeptide--D-alanyl-D-alanine ligase [Bacteroidota bacterium]